ncbi:MAG: glucosaminidase domain-containing protein [Pseudomonadota bacterium]
MSPSDFLDQLVPAAQACQRASGIPASFTLAQAALESAWGASKLAQRAFNLFGVKADRAWKGATLAMETAEFVNGKRLMVTAQWRAYPDWLACLTDRAAFFRANKRYTKCFDETTGEGWVRAVAVAGYATDPEYAEKLLGVIRGRNLTRFDQVQ